MPRRCVAAEPAAKGVRRDLSDPRIGAHRPGHGKAPVRTDVDRMAQIGEGAGFRMKSIRLRYVLVRNQADVHIAATDDRELSAAR